MKARAAIQCYSLKCLSITASNAYLWQMA